MILAKYLELTNRASCYQNIVKFFYSDRYNYFCTILFLSIIIIISYHYTYIHTYIQRGIMKQILFAYGLPKETVTVIMILNKNTKAMVHSTNGDTDFFDIVARILQGNTLAAY